MSYFSKAGLAIVTGASSGIGSVYADRLAARGHGLLLVARRADRLWGVADDIRSRHGVDVRIEIADLGEPSGLAKIENFVRESEVALLVNNAGAGGFGGTDDQSADRLTGIVQLNVLALTRLSHAALEVFKARGSGTLVNVGSIVAFLPANGAAAYSGSKAYVLNYTRSLQEEFAGSDIRIQLLQPGPIRTEFLASAGVGDDLFPPETFLTTEQLVDAALAGLDGGEEVSTPSVPDVGTWNDLEEKRQAFIDASMSGRVADRYADWAATAQQAPR